MHPFLYILGREIPTYGAIAMGAVVLGLLLSILFSKKMGLSGDDCAYIYVFGGIGALVGAKILYLLIDLPEIIQNIHLLWEKPLEFFSTYLSGGLVFYGGLLGALAGAALAARYFSKRFLDFFPVFIPIFPLVHGICRIGCFMAGCCYGRPASWGIAFTESIAAPNGVKLIPVQLFECGAELLISGFLFWYASRKPANMRLLAAYFMLYAPMRFILEFFRGDTARGYFGPLSTSQWISILIFLAGAVLWFFPSILDFRKKKPAATE